MPGVLTSPQTGHPETVRYGHAVLGHHADQVDGLESTRLPMDAVAEQAGFRSPVSFRQSFKRAMQVSPSDWRRIFAS